MYSDKPKKPTMTSLEAAALYLSNGSTTDPVKADAMANGTMLDPDKLERASYRRAMGFDFEIRLDPVNNRAFIYDLERELHVSCIMTTNEADNASRLAKACLKLKKLHDRLDDTPTAI